MTVQEQIDALLAEAAPLRLLADDEAEQKGLPKMVDRINALRALPPESEAVEPVKRGPGRPKKAD
jgi:hypothetical protein